MYINTVWGLYISLAIFLFGFLIIIPVSKKFNVDKFRGMALYTWHSIFCVIYYIYTLYNVSDAVGYYIHAKDLDFHFSLGTDAVRIIIAPFIYILDLPYLGANLIFNIFGSIGLVIYDSVLCKLVKNKSQTIKKFAKYFVFIPSMSFWSCALGKDAISFLSVNLLLWSSFNLKVRIFSFYLAFLLMLLVRPHIAAVMAISFVVLYVTNPNTNKILKIFIAPLFVLISIYVVFVAIEHAGVGDASITGLTSYVESRQSSNLEGGSSVDISSMSLPLKIFTYLFRPTIFDSNSVFALVTALENLILTAVFLAYFRYLKIGASPIVKSQILLWVYSIITLIILSLTTANLGIAIRQKWMFLPILLYLIIYKFPDYNKRHKKPLHKSGS